MSSTSSTDALPPIPPKRYFTIGEVSELCGVKPHVLRYWEQEFTQLRPLKRRGNRRYYQHHEVLMIRRIRELLYDQGFTIHGARNRLAELVQQERARPASTPSDSGAEPGDGRLTDANDAAQTACGLDRGAVLAELRAIRALLDTPAGRGHGTEMAL